MQKSSILNIQMFRRSERNLREYDAFDRNKTRECGVVTGSVRSQINVLDIQILAHKD